MSKEGGIAAFCVPCFLFFITTSLGMIAFLLKESRLLDIVAYAGYTFTGLSVAVLGRIFSGYAYYFLLPWTCLCMGVFLVKTMKRIIFAKVRSYDSSRHHYAATRSPGSVLLLVWLGNIILNWLF